MAEWTDEYGGVLKVVERVLRYDLKRLKRTPGNKKNLAALRMMSGVEAQKERGIRMCEKLVELLHIATLKIG